MPKRTVKRVSWPVESERMVITLSMKRRMQKVSMRSATSAISVWDAASNEEDRFYAVARAAFGAYELGQYALAREIAQRAIEVSPSFKQNWNYGNALFAGHTVLGLLALNDGHVNAAIQKLHASAMNGGSPQLGSFGPSMRLAKRLLEIGRGEDVLAFLHQSLTFWKRGAEWVAVWEKKIRRGSVPNFFMHLHA